MLKRLPNSSINVSYLVTILLGVFIYPPLSSGQSGLNQTEPKPYDIISNFCKNTILDHLIMILGLKKVPTYEWNMKKVAKSRGRQDSKSRCLIFRTINAWQLSLTSTHRIGLSLVLI
jgi:hypothetical protein